MADIRYPVSIALLDDDFYALKWNTALGMRDPRTTVTVEAEIPRQLVAQIKKKSPPDVVLVDVEYAPERIPLDELLGMITEKLPEAVVVCTSQYGDEQVIATAMQHGVRGFLLKQEVRMAIVPAVIHAVVNGLVVTPSIFEKLPSEYTFGQNKAHVFPVWKPNPRLTPQIIKSFWLRVFFGMRASLAAEELFVETTTIERYVNQAYKILSDGWADETYMFDVDLTGLSPEDQAFVWFTLPPRKDAF
jgi:DNA-binding NarL/FixJ family response regulator